VDHFSLIRSVRQRRPLLQALDVLHEDVGLLTRFFEQVMAVTSAAKVSPHMMARQAVVLLRISRLPLLRSDSWQQTKITKEKKMSGKKKGQDKAETVEQCVLREGEYI
jgi:hypothetical protein